MYQINDDLRKSLLDTFKKYAVKDVSSLEEFITKYLKPDHYNGTLQQEIAKRTETIARHGYTIIPNPDSTTNDIAVYYSQQ
jgi:hypothetical protein